MEQKKAVIISRIPDHKDLQFLEDKIYEFNVSKTNRNDGELFSKWIQDEMGERIAGITGWQWADACEITLFWVDAKHRHQGCGSLLLFSLEEDLKKTGCKLIFLRTYNFQAPEFYKKNGFLLQHLMIDFPPGYQSFFLVKKLAK